MERLSSCDLECGLSVVLFGGGAVCKAERGFDWGGRPRKLHRSHDCGYGWGPAIIPDIAIPKIRSC